MIGMAGMINVTALALAATAPPTGFVASLKFNDARNSQYVALVLRRQF